MCIYNSTLHIYLSIMPKFQDDSNTITHTFHARRAAAIYRKEKKVEKRKNRKQQKRNGRPNKIIHKYYNLHKDLYARMELSSFSSDQDQSHSAPNISQVAEMDAQSFQTWKKTMQQLKDDFQEVVLLNKMEDFNIEEKQQCQKK